MQTIKFNAELRNGKVQIPKTYRNWEGRKVRVILSTQDTEKPRLTDLSRHAGVIALNEEPADFQRRMRDEWM